MTFQKRKNCARTASSCLVSIEAMAVPEGYEAVVAFKLCPPGGILFQLGIYIFAPLATLGSSFLFQLSTFV